MKNRIDFRFQLRVSAGKRCCCPAVHRWWWARRCVLCIVRAVGPSPARTRGGSSRRFGGGGSGGGYTMQIPGLRLLQCHRSSPCICSSPCLVFGPRLSPAPRILRFLPVPEAGRSCLGLLPETSLATRFSLDFGLLRCHQFLPLPLLRCLDFPAMLMMPPPLPLPSRCCAWTRAKHSRLPLLVLSRRRVLKDLPAATMAGGGSMPAEQFGSLCCHEVISDCGNSSGMFHLGLCFDAVEK